MKKSKILAAAMASIALTGALSSCGKEEEFDAEYNANVCVYGPPPVVSEEGEGDNTADGNELFATSEAEGEQAAASQGD